MSALRRRPLPPILCRAHWSDKNPWMPARTKFSRRPFDRGNDQNEAPDRNDGRARWRAEQGPASRDATPEARKCHRLATRSYDPLRTMIKQIIAIGGMALPPNLDNLLL